VPSPTNAQLGAAIRQERLSRKLSLEELASGIGISWQYLSGIERGQKNPSWAVVTGLADHLDVGIVELARRAGGLST